MNKKLKTSIVILTILSIILSSCTRSNISIAASEKIDSTKENILKYQNLDNGYHELYTFNSNVYFSLYSNYIALLTLSELGEIDDDFKNSLLSNLNSIDFDALFPKNDEIFDRAFWYVRIMELLEQEINETTLDRLIDLISSFQNEEGFFSFDENEVFLGFNMVYTRESAYVLKNHAFNIDTFKLTSFLTSELEKIDLDDFDLEFINNFHFLGAAISISNDLNLSLNNLSDERFASYTDSWIKKIIDLDTDFLLENTISTIIVCNSFFDINNPETSYLANHLHKKEYNNEDTFSTLSFVIEAYNLIEQSFPFQINNGITDYLKKFQLSDGTYYFADRYSELIPTSFAYATLLSIENSKQIDKKSIISRGKEYLGKIDFYLLEKHEKLYYCYLLGLLDDLPISGELDEVSTDFREVVKTLDDTSYPMQEFFCLFLKIMCLNDYNIDIETKNKIITLTDNYVPENYAHPIIKVITECQKYQIKYYLKSPVSMEDVKELITILETVQTDDINYLATFSILIETLKLYDVPSSYLSPSTKENILAHILEYEENGMLKKYLEDVPSFQALYECMNMLEYIQ